MLPFLVAGAIVGLGAHISASADNAEAKNKNERANEIIEESTQLAQDAKKNCQTSMDTLAQQKAAILKGNMKRFVKSFSRIKPVNFSETGDLFETANFNKNELMVMQTMVNSVEKVSINEVAGGVSGTALAIGAADILTGGSILGGAGISVGGLAGGAALGAIAAPVFAITGIFSASEASANLEKANSNLAKARAYEDECQTYAYFASAVGERCELFYQTLNNIDTAWFTTAVNQLETLVNSKKTFGNFFKNISGKKIYSRQEMATVASVAALAKMMKTIIDTNIIDDEGNITEESENVIREVQDRLDSGEPLVKIPVQEPRQQQFQPQQQQFQPQQQQFQPQQQQFQPQQQQLQAQQQEVQRQQRQGSKEVYHPGLFACIVMWLCTIFFGGLGAILVIGGLFITGVVWFAAGLMMCPRINPTLRFWPRVGLMFLLLIIGVFLV